jgi:hypothetical protein
MRKKIFSVLLSFLIFVLCSVTSFATFGYSGELDPETGEAMASSSDGVSGGSRITMSDGSYYDRTRRGYVYTAGNSTNVLCSVADGMIVNDSVKVEADSGIETTLYKNGTAVENPDFSNISEVGDYVVEVSVEGQKYQPVSFSIVSDVTCKISGYTMPAGFSITGATLDDTEIAYESGFVDMSKEGHYVIDYACSANGLSYTLDITVDTTPPVLALAELNDKNQARGPVSIADVEEGASIGITLNGKEISYSSELTESGQYQITLIDKAGNITHYSFTILVYFSISTWALLGCLLAVAAAVFIYIYISKKRLAVR